MEVISMTLEEMKKRKQELGYSVSDLARLSGLPQATLQKIFSGITKSPRHETLSKLEAILKAPEVPEKYTMPGTIPCVKEAVPVYGAPKKEPDNPYGTKKQGEYTIEDYLALPDDKRYELIDGVIYEMSAPTVNHQDIAGFLYHILWNCVDKHQLPCSPYISPLDIQLDKDNKTMVQPDVIIICDPKQELASRIFGAPDFVAEVLSPSTRRRDLLVKLNKYMNAGVKEYWIIDPKEMKVIVWLFGPEDKINIYSFDDDIPVSLSQGLCTVNFSPLKERMARRKD